MNTTTVKHSFFDTHTFVKKLIKAGFTEKQAEVLADEQTVLIENTLATKRDIFDLKRDITDIKKDIAVLKKDLIIAMGSIMAVGIAILGTLKYFG